MEYFESMLHTLFASSFVVDGGGAKDIVSSPQIPSFSHVPTEERLACEISVLNWWHMWNALCRILLTWEHQK